jgi:protein dpy-30
MINNSKNLSTRAYLEMTVVPHVMSGMTELAREKPDNPLEWLGNYLIKQGNKKN